MTRLLAGALAVCVLAAGETSDPSKEDLARMQGDWAAESMVRDGQRLPDEDVQAYFRTMKLDATKTPKAIDFTPDGGKAPPIAGIYALDGDTLTICLAPPGKPRPTKLAAEADSGNTLWVWKREKK